MFRKLPNLWFYRLVKNNFGHLKTDNVKIMNMIMQLCMILKGACLAISFSHFSQACFSDSDVMRSGPLNRGLSKDGRLRGYQFVRHTCCCSCWWVTGLDRDVPAGVSGKTRVSGARDTAVTHAVTEQWAVLGADMSTQCRTLPSLRQHGWQTFMQPFYLYAYIIYSHQYDAAFILVSWGAAKHYLHLCLQYLYSLMLLP